jgi:hypothetical protein
VISQIDPAEGEQTAALAIPRAGQERPGNISRQRRNKQASSGVDAQERTGA